MLCFQYTTQFNQMFVVLLKEHLDRLQKKYIAGAPDLAVEVISPGSKIHDRLTKYSIYERAGVSEYWLINVTQQTIEVFVLDMGAYRSLGIYEGKQHLPSRIVPDMTVPVSHFFDWAAGLL